MTSSLGETPPTKSPVTAPDGAGWVYPLENPSSTPGDALGDAHKAPVTGQGPDPIREPHLLPLCGPCAP